MNEELIRMVLEECQRREVFWRKEAEQTESCDKRALSIYAATSYSSAASMLEYALKGDRDCLDMFMTKEPE